MRPFRVVGLLLTALLLATLGSATGAAAQPARQARPAAQAQPTASGTLLRPNVGLYPRAIRLRHSGAANGTVIASVVTFAGNNGHGAIYASTDGGATFDQIGTVADPHAANGQGLCCSSIYELPRQVGALPAGTLLWAASIRQSSGADRRMEIRLWRSDDHGHTWSLLATPAIADNTGGLWEPEMAVTADGRLAIYFSDETQQPAHSQTLVESVSADGVHWSATTNIVAGTDPAARPGMAMVRRLPDGRYFMTYEVCGAGYDCAVHRRTSRDGVHWGDPADLGPQIRAADGRYFLHTPSIAWYDNGTRNGRLVLVGQILDNADGSVAAGSGDTVMVSADLGRTWHEQVAPVSVPHPYNNYCPNYSSALLPSTDGRHLLEIATDYAADGVCKAYYATGPLTGSARRHQR